MIETNNFGDNLSNTNGKNDLSSYKEINNSITNQAFDTNLQNCPFKCSDEEIAEIVPDSFKPIEANSYDGFNPETIVSTEDSKNEEKASFNTLKTPNSEQFIDLNYNEESSVLEMENSDDENEAEWRMESVLRHSHRNPLPCKITQHKNQQINAKVKLTDFGQSSSTENVNESNSPFYLPDILTSLNKSEAGNKRRNSDSPNSDFGTTPKSKSLFTQSSYLPKQLRSDALQNETETEIKQLKNLHSLQSIYKFAYDENVTDQSEAGSKSPSPLDPESNVPSSLTSAEILIHEADSGSDAGSEDVELLPHRYESETSMSENKHVYVNRLSLAVELLRTQETLPYDDEFKRVTGENSISNNAVATEKIKRSLEEDLQKTLTSQSQVKQTSQCTNDSREGSLEGFCIQEDSGTEKGGNRKFGVHQYISQKAAVSMDPWVCCIIM